MPGRRSMLWLPFHAPVSACHTCGYIWSHSNSFEPLQAAGATPVTPRAASSGVVPRASPTLEPGLVERIIIPTDAYWWGVTHRGTPRVTSGVRPAFHSHGFPQA